VERAAARGGGKEGGLGSEALPRTSTGKFMKTKLRQEFKDWVSKTPD